MRAVALSVLEVFRLLTRDVALVIAIDDLQWLDASSRGVRQHGARFPRSPELGLVKFWSSSSGEERRRATKPELRKTLNFGRWRSLASGGDAFRVNRTQEVAGSSPASYTRKRPALRAFLFAA